MRSSLGLHANPKQSPDGIVEIMSSLDPDPEEVDPSAVPGARHAADILEARKAAIGGERSPTVVHTPLVGLEAALSAAGNVTLATRPDLEYGPMAADPPASITVRNTSLVIRMGISGFTMPVPSGGPVGRNLARGLAGDARARTSGKRQNRIASPRTLRVYGG
jgi:hypothetical protein